MFQLARRTKHVRDASLESVSSCICSILTSGYLISCLNTSFRIANKECHGNYVLISKEQHWRSPAKIPTRITLRYGQEISWYGIIKTYFNNPSKSLKRKQENVSLFEFELIIPAVLKCLSLFTHFCFNQRFSSCL